MMLQELHQGHMEMSKMKSLARMYVWWPSLDKDIEDSVCACRSVKPISHSHPQLHCTCGVGLHVVRPGYTVTMQDHSKTTCSLLQSMPIQRGSKHFQFSQQPQASLLTNSGVCSHSLGCQRSLWQTMDFALSVRNSSHSCMSMASSTSHLYHITRPRMASQRAVQIEIRMG